MSALSEEGDESRLEVAPAGVRHRCVKLLRRAVEDVFAVGQDEEPVAVALGLDQVVRCEDHRCALARQAQDELP